MAQLWLMRETQYYVATPPAPPEAPSILFVSDLSVACRYLSTNWKLWRVDIPSRLRIVDGFAAYDLLVQLEPRMLQILFHKGGSWQRRSIEREDNLVFESLKKKMPFCDGIHWSGTRNFHSETVLFLPIRGLKLSRVSSRHCHKGDLLSLRDGLPTGKPSSRTRSKITLPVFRRLEDDIEYHPANDDRHGSVSSRTERGEWSENHCRNSQCTFPDGHSGKCSDDPTLFGDRLRPRCKAR
jgi:hypothetical protein